MLLGERFEAVAAAHPRRPALCSGTESLSYSDLTRRCRVLAARFQERGVEPGDRVAILAENRVEVVVAFWATLELGAVAVVLDRRLDKAELAEILGDCEPALIGTSVELGDVEPTPCRLDGPEGPFVNLSGEASPVAWDGEETRPAVIIYTSGSSGKAKGVCLSHRNLWTVTRTVIAQTSLTPLDSYLLAVPLHYVHGIMQLLAHHLAGAALHIAGDFSFPAQIVKRLGREHVTGFSGVPFHFARMIDHGGFLETELPRLRWVTVTGGKCPPERLRQVLAAKPELDVYIAYGQSECAPRATLLDPSRLHRKIDSVGSAIPGVEVRILDTDGSELPRGEVGEIVVAGDNVMLGYWRDPEATRRVVDESGQLHTGDLGYVDEEGDLFLTGRRSSMIKSGGERIFAERVEQVLRDHDAVRDVVVVGVADAELGERVEAHVLLAAAPANKEETRRCRSAIRRHALARLPFAHAPREVHLWTEFPYKANGKVDREAIRTGTGTPQTSAGGHGSAQLRSE